MARTLIKEIKDKKKNYAINGNFNLWQRTNANQTFGSQITYHADRFAWASGTITAQVTSARAVVSSGYSNTGIIPRSCTYMQQYIVSTAQPSLSANSTAGPWYKMEGFDWQEMLEQGALSNGLTLSFYVASSVTGTYTIELFNSGIDNRFTRTYSINSANTWQRVSMYFSAAEVVAGIASGTWNYTNNLGLAFRFWLAAGTAAQGVNQNVWTGSNPNVPAAQVNFLSTLSNSWGITGLSITIGNVTPDFKIRGESPESELALCQRYYEKSFEIDTNPANGPDATTFATNVGIEQLGCIPWASGDWGSNVAFKTVKRAAPGLGIFGNNAGHWAYSVAGTLAGSATPTFSSQITLATPSQRGFYAINNVATSALIGVKGHWSADAEL